MSDYRKGPRRRHSAEFKMEVVRACAEPGASAAAVALSFGINANLARQWVRGRGFKRASVASELSTPAPKTSSQRFVPLALPAASDTKRESPSPAGEIRVQMRRGSLQVDVSWPQSAGADCAAWLRELLR